MILWLPLPIRVRLTLWYSLVFATTLFSLEFASLWMVHRAIDDLEKNELQQRVRSVRRFIESRPDQETTAQLHDAITSAYDVSHGNKWLQVIDEHGAWLYRSPHVSALYPTLTWRKTFRLTALTSPIPRTPFTYTLSSNPSS